MIKYVKNFTLINIKYLKLMSRKEGWRLGFTVNVQWMQNKTKCLNLQINLNNQKYLGKLTHDYLSNMTKLFKRFYFENLNIIQTFKFY